MKHSHSNPNPRSSLDYLVLLGLVCQGFSFDNWLVPILYALVWGICLKMRPLRPAIPAAVENGITLLAILAAHRLGADYSYNRLIFIGNALVVFQAMRLLRPLRSREKAFSLAVALIHLTVGAQVVVDYKFALVLIASLLLIPRTFFELEVANYPHLPAGQHRPRWYREAFAIALIMLLFFLLFPRFRVLSAVSPLPGGGIRPSRELEMAAAGPGEDTGSQMLFRIEGPEITYIKRTALDRWDGTRWTQSEWIDKAKRFPYDPVPPEALHRSVKILQASLLDNAIPVDGHVLRLAGTFLQRPYVAEHGGVMTVFGERRNREYEYWTLPASASPGNLTSRDRNRHLDLPPTSDALRQWLQTQTRTLTDPDDIARTLAEHFRSNHQYQLGTPDLDRFNPIDDFVLNQRDGHCERFASALAVLLRLKGIPSRVALGWLAVERNNLGGFYNVRVRHAHAWTEAWLDGQGWTIVDATPYGQAIPRENRPFGFTLFEWLEYMWYSKVVEFGVAEQSGLVRFSTRGLRQAIGLATRHMPLIAILVLAAFLLGRFRSLVGRLAASRRSIEPSRQQAVREARHFYGRMLRLLAKHHQLVRRPSQTPMEFLAMVEEHGHPRREDIRDLSVWFCSVRYGNAPLSPDQRHQIRRKLANLEKR